MDAETQVSKMQGVTEGDGEDELDKLLRKTVTVSQVNLPMAAINKDIDDIAKSCAEENERPDNALDGQFVRLLERTRQRRELLDQKMGKTPEAAPRKRRSPLTENTTHNVGGGSAQTEASEGSPKRPCLREAEGSIKPDTPAIASVKSRLQSLATQRAFWSEENEGQQETVQPLPSQQETVRPLPHHQETAQPTPDQQEMVQPTSQRKNRFAKLASNISNWEDDLSHPIISKEEEKKPRWQPPKGTDTKTVTASNKPSPKKSPVPPSSATKKACSGSPVKLRNKVELSTSSKSDVSKTLGKQEESRQGQEAEAPMDVCSEKENNAEEATSKVSEQGKIAKGKVDQQAAKLIKEAENKDRLRKDDAKGTETPKAQAVIPPSERPLSARLANWEQKISENKSDVLATPKSGIAVSTKVGSTPKNLCTPARPLNTPARPLSTPLPEDGTVQMRPKARRAADDEPTTHPVSARMSAWELMSSAQAVSSVKKVKPGDCTPVKTQTGKNSLAKTTAAATPGKTPAQDNIKEQPAVTVASTTPGRSQGQSPKKVGSAMKMAQQQFAQQSQSSDMAERLRQERMAELQSIQNRWKNGILKDEKEGQSQAPDGEETAHTRRQGQRERARAVLDEEETGSEPVDIKSIKDMTVVSGISCNQEESHHGQVAEQVSIPVEEGMHGKSQDVTCGLNSTCNGNGREKSIESQSLQRQECYSSRQLLGLQNISSTELKSKLVNDRSMIKEDTVTQIDKLKTTCATTEMNESEKKKENDKLNEPNSQYEKNLSTQSSQPYNFDKKLATIGLDGHDKDKTTSQCKDTVESDASKSKPETTDAPSSCKARPTSLYSIVSQQKTSTPNGDSDKVRRRVKFDDSFDSVDDLQTSPPEKPVMEKDAESNLQEDNRMEDDADFEVVLRRPRRGAQGQQQRPEPSNEDDDLSLSAFVPESVRRESILPSSQGQCDSDQDSSFNSLDSFQGAPGAPPDIHKSTVDLVKLGQQYADSSNSPACSTSRPQPSSQHGPPSMEESVDDRDAIGDLLDEAMDSEEESTSAEPPVPVMRKKTAAQRQATGAGDLPFSLNEYRASRNMQIQEVKQTIVRNSQYAGMDIKEEDVEMPAQAPVPAPRRNLQDKIKEMQELVQQEQNVIMQTSNALNQCYSSSYFAGSSEQVECNRILLISCQKRQAYLREMQRLKESKVLNQTGPGPTGSLTINDIRLPLKKEFVTKIGTSQDTMTYYFILLLKNGPHVICTQMLSTHDPLMRGSLDFPNLIKINGITGAFHLQLEIYMMSMPRESANKEKKKKTPKKMKGSALTVQSPGGPLAVRTTSFTQVTTVQLTMKSLDKHCFNLDRLSHLSPLHGTIYMNLKCLMEASVEERGFLTMFEDVSGFGSWHRRWCALRGNKLQYWKYPDDETRKDPMGYIDLKRCVTEKIGLISRDICARPHTFELCTVRQPQKGEKDTLVSRTYSTMTTVRHMLSADTKEERIVWCNQINKALANIRTWHPDAMRPVHK